MADASAHEIATNVHSFSPYRALGGEWFPNITDQTSIGVFVYVPKYHNFGFIVGSYIDYIAPSLFELHSNPNLFTYWQMSGKQMIDGHWHFKYQSTGMSFNDFIPITPENKIRDFRPGNVNNVAQLNDISILRRISHCLLQSVKVLLRQIKSLENDIETANANLHDSNKKFKRYVKQTRDIARMNIAMQLNKKIIMTGGGGHIRVINYKHPNLLPILWDQLFLIQNGKEYTEKHMVNGNEVEYSVKLCIEKVGTTKYTTKTDNGYCPPAAIEELLDFGRIEEQTSDKNGSYNVIKGNITYMINSNNLMIDIETASHSTHMIQGLYASLI